MMMITQVAVILNGIYFYWGNCYALTSEEKSCKLIYLEITLVVKQYWANISYI